MVTKKIEHVAPARTETLNSLVQPVQRVTLDVLKVHPRNPNTRPNLDSILDSLKSTGLYRPLVVQQSTMYVLTGNHTYLAARRLGWSHIDVIVLDVDDDTASRIMLSDNRIAKDGVLDDRLVADLLRDLPDVAGTGYDPQEFDALLKSITPVDVSATLEGIASTVKSEEQQREAAAMNATFDGAPLGEEPDPRVTIAGGFEPGTDPGTPNSVQMPGWQPNVIKEGGVDLEKANEVLPSVFQLGDEIPNDTVGFWNLPRMRTDRVVTLDTLPQKLESWAGKYSLDWFNMHELDINDPEQYFILNWGVENSRRLPDIKRVIIAFYSYDKHWDNWWYFPDRYVTKCLNSGINMIITPNYSQYADQHRAISLWALYRNRFLARYFQEAGLNIIPDIEWPHGQTQYQEDLVLGTLPKGLPLISLQMQMHDKEAFKEKHEVLKREFQNIFDILEPQGLMLHAGLPGRDWFFDNIDPRCDVRFITSRITRIGEVQKNEKRTKKLTI